MLSRVQAVLGVSVLLSFGAGCGNTSGGGNPAGAGNGGEAGTSAGASGVAGSSAGSAGSAGADPLAGGNAGMPAGGAAGAAGTSTGGAGPGGSDAGGAPSAGAGFGGTTNAGSGGMSPNFGGASGGAGGPPIDIGPQKTSSQVDVLFVVDNSVSMADKQNILEASLPRFVKRLVNPTCIDGQGNPTAQQPASGAAACSTGKREFSPVTDLHLGVISTSIGAHGGTVCASGSTGDTLDDHAQLLPSLRTNLASYNNSGYASFDTAGVSGSSDVNAVIANLQAMVTAAGEHGCGYEAPLEAMYRFLVDPEPPVTVEKVNGVSTPTGINTTLLTQRNAFLRPDSSVAVVILSDENDCSIRDDGVGWFVGSSQHMPRSTSACAASANDPCCRSCAVVENAPPAGCLPLSQDSVCMNVTPGQQWATWDMLHDSLNLRCFNQRQRFGFDLLYPVDRYTNGLTNPQVPNRSGQLVDNPLLAARNGKGPRSATLISVSVIVGAPWQDLATTASLTQGQPLTYLDGAGLSNNARWPVLLGAGGVPPSDPFMRESIDPRSGKNPLTQAPIVAATSPNPQQSPINGHEQNILNFDDLQYACTFTLAASRLCAKGNAACDCTPDNAGDASAVVAANSPLCQPPAGGAASTTQYYGKGYPGARELSLVQALGTRAVAASICPKTLADSASADYAYTPALNTLIGRIAMTLK